MPKDIYCGSACVKYILDSYNINDDKLRLDMLWVPELAISLKKAGVPNIRVNCYHSNLYNDFISNRKDKNIDGFKFLDEAQKHGILIKEKSVSINSFIKEIDSSKYLILCVESKIFNNDISMSGGHYIIISGRNKMNINVINPVKDAYNFTTINIKFLIESCKNYGSWRILIGEA